MSARHDPLEARLRAWLSAEPSGNSAAEPELLARLRARLTLQAQRRNLLDVAYRVVDSPIGPLLLVGTSTGIVRVAFEREDHQAVLAEIAGSVSPRILESARPLERAARELRAYFTRRRRTFDVPLDLRLASRFRRDVLGRLARIEYGTTVSYGELAARAGRPKAVRSAASACAQNPLPLFLPCHRVVRSDGSFGEYRGGADAKHWLLELES